MSDDESGLSDDTESESTESADFESGDKTVEGAGLSKGWAKFQAITPLITPVVVAAVGFYFTGKVNQTIQRSQLQFNYVKEMQELLSKLGESKTTAEEAKTTAVALAAFGSYSIPPLLNEIESGQPNRQAAAEYGLRAVALADPKSTCPILGRVLENRTAAYNWMTNRAAIRILGSANCENGPPILQGYLSRLNAAGSSGEAFKKFAATLADEPPATRENLDQLKSEVDKSLKLLEQGRMQR